MADEFDKGLPDEVAVAALGGDEVAQGEQREQQANKHTGDELPCPVAPPPPGKLVVPPGRQELLAVWLSDKLQEKQQEWRQGKEVELVSL